MRSVRKQKIIDRNDKGSPNLKLFHLVAIESLEQKILWETLDGLFKNGADIDARDQMFRNNSILIWGIANANVDIVCQYLAYIRAKFPKESVEEINHPATNGITPLHLAVYKGWDHQYEGRGEMFKVVKALLESGSININARDEWGNTPLHIAMMRKDYACAFLLLSKGAAVSLDMRNKDGQTPGDMFNMSYQEVARICQDRCHAFTLQERSAFEGAMPITEETGSEQLIIPAAEEVDNKFIDNKEFHLVEDDFNDKNSDIAQFIISTQKFSEEIKKLRKSRSLTKESFLKAFNETLAVGIFKDTEGPEIKESDVDAMNDTVLDSFILNFLKTFLKNFLSFLSIKYKDKNDMVEDFLGEYIGKLGEIIITEDTYPRMKHN